MEMHSVLLMNGPNLDMLGTREPAVYGSTTLPELEAHVASYAAERGIKISRYQSNSEGDLVTAIQCARTQFDGIIYNPGAHTHYSYALRDAIAGIDIPVVEVHISDVSNREAFRRISVIAPVCVAQVKGLGIDGYCRAVDILCELPELVRLGEGYEAHFSDADAIKVAGAALAVESGNRDEDAALPGSPDGPEAAESELDGSDALQSDVALAAKPDSLDEDAVLLGSPDEQEAEEAVKSELDESTELQSDAADDADQENEGTDKAALSRQRQQLVRDACSALGVESFLVRETSNIKWITAIDGVFDEERAHALLVTPSGAHIHTDSRYSNALRMQLEQMGSNIVVDDERVGHMAFARRILSDADGAIVYRMAIEDSITYAEYAKAVEELGIESLAASTDVVVGLRAVKTQDEIVRMKAAQAVTDAAFLHIIDYMRPGMTEREVQLELEDFMLRHGGEGLAFSSIVATGANGADPHAIPGSTQLEAGQCVVMDFGARACGYCSDMTRMVFLGEPDAKLVDAWAVLKSANEMVQSMLKPGVTGKQAHELAEQVLADGGYAGRMGHGLGHGVGLDVHELPVLNLRNDKPLVEGNVVTVEPGIYVPGEFGMRLEDCGVVTATGYEVFSGLGHEIVVI